MRERIMMYHFSNFELTSARGFDKFAKAFDGTFELSQFRRISDMIISWETGKYGSHTLGVTSPNVFVTLDFDDNDNRYFVMEVKFGNESVYCEKFNSPMAALNYLNACVNIIQARKKRVNSIWEEYGF